jgi:thiamine-monophosphate kinase
LKDLEEYAKSYKLDLNNLVFNGGEEYEFVFTVTQKYKKIVEKTAKLTKTRIFEIGYVTSGKGVYIEKNNKFTRLKDGGWKHF